MSDYIPQKLLPKILACLPARSLVRFTSVCKTWQSLITSSDFITAHRQSRLSTANNEIDAYEESLVLLEYGNTVLQCSNSDYFTARARQHIQLLRIEKFSIGKNEENSFAGDLHRAITTLIDLLYRKDVHFLTELIQNAEDNRYLNGVEPSLEFVLTTKDLTGCGAPATLLVFNNEIGFTAKNMNSICSVGQSTKKGLRNQGIIGKRGFGFKSVFLVSAQPHIFSKGYQVKFNELPTKGSGVGYIVPEWVDINPIAEDIECIYGHEELLPTTTIILPLKPDKVELVKKQLSEELPQVIFLKKIKRMVFRENNGDS